MGDCGVDCDGGVVPLFVFGIVDGECGGVDFVCRILGCELGFAADDVDGGTDVLPSSGQYSEFIGGERATLVCTKEVINKRFAPMWC